ncbi:MAG: hypothetical protein CMF38_02400 [Legionellaceae bacterium]|nr:hypothetical protein [Legionellaceae bacterium]|tara:strand:+ start:103 stop:405 length:303 start_codon:yes stop_codon:yes gene_type:complete
MNKVFKSRKIWLLILITLSIAYSYSYSQKIYKKVVVKRNKPMSVQELGIVADLDSARNQKGQPVILESGIYILTSFKNTTMSVKNIKNLDLGIITLDIKK